MEAYISRTRPRINFGSRYHNLDTPNTVGLFMKETADKIRDSARDNFGAFTIGVEEVYQVQDWNKVRSTLSNHAIMYGCVALHYQPTYRNFTSGVLAIGALTLDKPILIDI